MTVQGRHVLSGQDQRDRPVPCFNRHAPCARGFVRITGPDHDQARNGAQIGELFHRLMSGPVLPHSKAVVREDIDHALLHHRRQAYWGPHVIGENEERRTVGYDAPMHGQSVQNRAHPVFANAKVQVAASIIPAAAARALSVARGSIRRFKIARVFQRSVRRGIQIRRTADEGREFWRDRAHHLS